jgi:hypothetical protein
LTGSAIQTPLLQLSVWPGTKPLFRAYIRTPVTGMVVRDVGFPSFEGKTFNDASVCGRLCHDTEPAPSIATAAAIHYGMRRNREENL